MTVLEETLASSRPNNDTIVCTTSGELLSIFLISNAIYGITMTANLFQTFTGNRIVYKHTVSHCHQQLCAIYYNKIISVILPGLKQAAQTVLVIFDSAGGGGYKSMNGKDATYNRIVPNR